MGKLFVFGITSSVLLMAMGLIVMALASVWIAYLNGSNTTKGTVQITAIICILIAIGQLIFGLAATIIIAKSYQQTLDKAVVETKPVEVPITMPSSFPLF